MKYLKEEQWVKTAFIIIDVQNILVETGFWDRKDHREDRLFARSGLESKMLDLDLFAMHILKRWGFNVEDYRPCWKIENEKVFQKQHNNMFKETGLKEYLIKEFNNWSCVVCRRSHCVDTSVKVGFE